MDGLTTQSESFRMLLGVTHDWSVQNRGGNVFTDNVVFYEWPPRLEKPLWIFIFALVANSGFHNIRMYYHVLPFPMVNNWLILVWQNIVWGVGLWSFWLPGEGHCSSKKMIIRCQIFKTRRCKKIKVSRKKCVSDHWPYLGPTSVTWTERERMLLMQFWPQHAEERHGQKIC